MAYLYESAGERDGLVGAVGDVTPEPDELAAAVGRSIERRFQTDRTRRTRTQHAPVGRLLRLRQRSLQATPAAPSIQHRAFRPPAPFAPRTRQVLALDVVYRARQ